MKILARMVTAVCMAAVLGCASRSLADQRDQQEVLERVFGQAAKLDPDMVAAVAQDEPGKRRYVDYDGDGKPEEVWFIDQALRHPKSWQPLLVRVIDEDGDLEMGREPDLDSDLYIADWKADGAVDSVCDYTDRDGDNDVDEMLLYYPGRGGNRLMIWWGDDVGDDNLLWFDVGYTYSQGACQYRCHFGGDELFCAYTIGLKDPEWLPAFENPFLFYDHDDDGVTEEVIRIEGRREIVYNVRHSFDVDNDATPDSPRDFDVCITAHAPKGLTFGEDVSDCRTIRGIPTGPFLSYDATPKYCLETQWDATILCWDENDLNIDGDNLSDGRFRDTQERWEGIICQGNEFFRQVGGPSSGPFNKRFEVATGSGNMLRVYYAPTDQRIHLFGADEMWLAVDVDYDQKADMRYEYADTDGDSRIDTWRFDMDADGEFDDEWTAAGTPTTDVGYTWAEVSAVMKPLLEIAPGQLFLLDMRLRQAAVKLKMPDNDGVWRLLESGFDLGCLSEDVRLRLLSSNETFRYYLDLQKDMLIVCLKQNYEAPGFWSKFAELRAKGDLDGMRKAVEEAFKLTAPLPDFAETRANILAKYDKPQVAWAEDWVPPNIGWESRGCGYRAYWGQFDFFGKKNECLVMSTFGDQVSYHEEQDWGIDALHVGKAPGLGGVTLYVNGAAYPVWSPEGKGDIVWSKQLVAENEDEVTVELLAEQVGEKEHPCTVRFRCSALAKRKDSPIEVTAEGGNPDDALELGIGLTKLPQETFASDAEAGIIANWGFQEPAIGFIGMGIIYPVGTFLRYADLPDHHQVVLRIEKGEPVTYHIQGDWLNGRRFPRCPTLENWLDDLRATARIAALK